MISYIAKVNFTFLINMQTNHITNILLQQQLWILCEPIFGIVIKYLTSCSLEREYVTSNSRLNISQNFGYFLRTSRKSSRVILWRSQYVNARTLPVAFLTGFVGLRLKSSPNVSPCPRGKQYSRVYYLEIFFSALHYPSLGSKDNLKLGLHYQSFCDHSRNFS